MPKEVTDGEEMVERRQVEWVSEWVEKEGKRGHEHGCSSCMLACLFDCMLDWFLVCFVLFTARLLACMSACLSLSLPFYSHTCFVMIFYNNFERKLMYVLRIIIFISPITQMWPVLMLITLACWQVEGVNLTNDLCVLPSVFPSLLEEWVGWAWYE